MRVQDWAGGADREAAAEAVGCGLGRGVTNHAPGLDQWRQIAFLLQEEATVAKASRLRRPKFEQKPQRLK